MVFIRGLSMGGFWKIKRRGLGRGFALLFFLCVAVTSQGNERDPDKFNIILDAEAEEVLRTFLDPMLKIVGIPAYKIRIMIVNTPIVNASAISGGVMAINTGLLLKVQDLTELLGVLAHEVGHFRGGHHTRIMQAAEKSQTAVIAGALIGGLAMAAGQGDAGMAAIMGGYQVAMQTYLAHRRGEESAADQSAVEILDALGISSSGLSTFMQSMASADFRIISRQEAYAQTHPVYAERVHFFQNHMMHSSFAKAPPPPQWQKMWERLQAKLKGFLMDPQSVIHSVPFPQSVPELYTLAVANYRKFDLPRALELAEKLIQIEPGNPYFKEFLGQILFETGHIEQSLPYYRQAIALRPKSPLLNIQAAHALIEAGGNSAYLTEAIRLLQSAVEVDKNEPLVWHFLGVAYGKQGDMGNAALSLAEKSLLTGEEKIAIIQAKKAISLTREGSPQRLRAQDIIQTSGQRQH